MGFFRRGDARTHVFQLGLSGMTMAETVHVAATQLGVDDSGGQPLVDVAAACMETLGVGGPGVSTEDITVGVEASAWPARAPLAAGSAEYERVADHFRGSLSPSERVRFHIVSIEKLHNAAHKDMYDVSLRHMGLREQNRQAAGKEALELDTSLDAGASMRAPNRNSIL